jgi:hypothetical protein
LFGIDLGENWIKVANELNEFHFKSDKVKFVTGDFSFVLLIGNLI